MFLHLSKVLNCPVPYSDKVSPSKLGGWKDDATCKGGKKCHEINTMPRHLKGFLLIYFIQEFFAIQFWQWQSHKCNILFMCLISCYINFLCSLSLVHTSYRLQQLSQRARPLQIIGKFLVLLQSTATVAGRSRFAATLNEPLWSWLFYYF